MAELWTEAGLLLFGVLFVVVWWRARTGDVRALSLAVLAPLATAFAYIVSELLKSLVHEERPCRAVAGAAASLVTCPPHGDWSFPSNHSTIAGAAAVALALALPRLGYVTLPMAVLMAFSRVFVGVHYPHDVGIGLVLGASTAALTVAALTWPLGRVLETMRASGTAAFAWFAGPGRPASAGRHPGSPTAPAAGPAYGNGPRPDHDRASGRAPAVPAQRYGTAAPGAPGAAQAYAPSRPGPASTPPYGHGDHGGYGRG
ncbi:phosphatase PAP2 family protein [Streptomyces sp. NRRL S-87]|uniref:phosphatase PAP2 family protein n=1 Tax=Streptomyces sp. NRRL S-87 TaxID=1463920 RepID=UPI002D218379|nr:phosphatase PAP2 family protein [Streptomyces sp. NRRL S-87]